MRIVGGSLGGRRFPGPRGSATRPTSERVREGIASALEARGAIDGARVLDLFAGTGALSFEALSRGAESALLVDADKRAVRSFAESAKTLGLTSRVRSLELDLFGEPVGIVRRILRAAGDAPFDLVFADPPWAEIARVPALLSALAAEGALADGAFVVLEHAVRRPPGDIPGLATVGTYRHGDTAVVLATQGAGEEEST